MIYYRIYEGVIELKPGERKLAAKENIMEEHAVPDLDGSDLYPAVIL